MFCIIFFGTDESPEPCSVGVSRGCLHNTEKYIITKTHKSLWHKVKETLTEVNTFLVLQSARDTSEIRDWQPGEDVSVYGQTLIQHCLGSGVQKNDRSNGGYSTVRGGLTTQTGDSHRS